MNTVPIVKDICLVGGGHSHALVLRQWAMQPIPGIRLTLVSSTVQTPYSGMLPGLIAGHYSYDDIHIDLHRLCTWATVRFVEDTVTAIDLDERSVQFAQRPPLRFDVLSLDTGSTPDLSVPGSATHVVPVKPVSDFHARWQSLRQRLEVSSSSEVSIGVVGSGAGGFELVTAMQHQLKDTSAQCYWFLRSNDAIQGRPDKVGQFAQEAALAAGIKVVSGFDVIEVKNGQLVAADGREASLDEIIWCTAATGPKWPEKAGLDIDSRGFVATNGCLQSTSHPFVFATGDIGTQVETPSNKAGVFAVRQAPYLFKNLRAFCLDQSLSVYRPQKDFLSLMATGPRHGIASRGPLVIRGNWVWRWKDHIDQTFMNRFRHLPAMKTKTSFEKLPDVLREQSIPSANPEASMSEVSNASQVTQMRCKGCGAKLGQNSLQRVLDELLPSPDGDAPGWSPAGDTAVLDLPAGQLVQSVDQINAIVDDPFLLGRIAALHAISDVLTQDAELHSAQITVTVPEARPNVAERDLYLMMSGVLSALEEESCALVGGHTMQGPDMSIGLVINATLKQNNAKINSAAVPLVQPGDCLILTQAIGIGTLFAGSMQARARGNDVTHAIHAMLTSNRLAADVLRQHGVTAMTDITGFGLVGHLLRLLQGVSLGTAKPDSDRQEQLVSQNKQLESPTSESESIKATGALGAGASVSLSCLPILDGALELSKQGCKSSLWAENAQPLSKAIIDDNVEAAALALLADPQTSGGLLAIVPSSAVDDCLIALRKAGYDASARIGTVEASTSLTIKQ